LQSYNGAGVAFDKGGYESADAGKVLAYVGLGASSAIGLHFLTRANDTSALASNVAANSSYIASPQMEAVAFDNYGRLAYTSDGAADANDGF
jgi:hypothetical protein